MSFKLGELLLDKPEMLERRDRCPTGKTVFYSKRDAQDALRRMGGHRTQMKEFRCGYCEKWHVGHRRGAVL